MTVNIKNPYDDPDDYDIKEQSYMNDYELILEWARRCGGHALDLGCGTGRLALPLAEAGIAVEGADVSRSMLDLAARKAEQAGVSVPLYEQDLTELRLPRGYEMMFMVGNTFQHLLTNEDQERMLQGVYRHLKPEGVFVFGTRNPDLEELSRVEVYEQHYANRLGQQVTEQHEEMYDAITQLLSCRTVKITAEQGRGDEISREDVHLQIRYTYPQEAFRLLKQSSFEVIQVYGGWKKEPLTSTSPEMIFICRKAG